MQYPVMTEKQLATRRNISVNPTSATQPLFCRFQAGTFL